jgi:hypothetical protein
MSSFVNWQWLSSPCGTVIALLWGSDGGYFMTTLKTALVLALCLVSFKTYATDDTQASVEINNTLQTMNQTKTDLSVEGEVADLDREEYEASEKQASMEIGKMREEIRRMESQSRSLTQGAERARLKAELAAKKLELSKKEQAELTRKVAMGEKEKNKAEQKNNQLKAQVDKMKEQVQQSKQKNRETLEDIRKAERENAQLMRSLEKAKKMIAEEKRKKDALRAKRVRISQNSSRIKSQLNKIAKRN